jgi:hypothetical protein
MAEWRAPADRIPADLIDYDAERWESETLSDEDRSTMTPRENAAWQWNHDPGFDSYRAALIVAVSEDAANLHAAKMMVERIRARLIGEVDQG